MIYDNIISVVLFIEREVLVLPPLDREIVISESKSGPRNLHRMSLVDLGKRLLEAAKRGETDEVRTLMSNGAPFTTDWVCTKNSATVSGITCLYLS